MVSQFWIDLYTNIGLQAGLNGASMSIMCSFLFSLGLAIACAAFLGRHMDEHQRETIGLISFFIFMILFSLAGAIDWIIVFLIAIVFLGIYGYTHKSGGGSNG